MTVRRENRSLNEAVNIPAPTCTPWVAMSVAATHVDEPVRSKMSTARAIAAAPPPVKETRRAHASRRTADLLVASRIGYSVVANQPVIVSSASRAMGRRRL